MTNVARTDHQDLWRSYALQLRHTPEYLSFYLKGFEPQAASRGHRMLLTTWWKLCLCKKPKDERDVALIEIELGLRPGTVQALLGSYTATETNHQAPLAAVL